ncbi:MAG: prepilin-type N-terminal cleavage/methylation domain-containing protein [Bacilli bacterium]|nr:prepilin-type N-terminal cleavage/methylation domain-containing protein [Bacilli bacterium]
MNHKGFTLIEIICAITILTVIALIATPIILDTLQESKEKAYVDQTKVLEETAEKWSIKNASLLTEDKEYYLELEQLVDEKLITSADVKDPRTNQTMKGCLVISYDKEHLQYDFNYNENTCASLNTAK